MKRRLETKVRALGWSWSHEIRIAVLVMILAVVMPARVRSQFWKPCREIITIGLSSISDTLDSVIRRGLKCIFGVDQDMGKFQRTVVWLW